MNEMKLIELGWQRYIAKQSAIQFDDSNLNQLTGEIVGRVSVENKTNFILHTKHGELKGIIQGKFRHNTKSSSDFPKVGDWVMYEKLPNEEKAIIKKVLPRYSSIARKAAGDTTDTQIIASNVDSLFIVFGLDKELNQPLLERYLTMAYEGGVQPIIILNKTDLAQSKKAVMESKSLAESLAAGLEVYELSAKNPQSLNEIETKIEPGRTIAFVGPSGVGKSTLINSLVGSNIQTTGEVRITDSKGRHTTTRRELFILPSGGILIDTPGIRELENLSSEQGLDKVFTDIFELANHCEFTNCDHIKSKNCAIINALHHNQITQERYDNFIKLLNEERAREGY